ncbi:9-O-acetylesterase [Pedobacter quisquiliarum]|uniref:9-O-acetylesterase n=1 Tax=Pedobacter quisquiliarum TaxID=1834438 RepID=A0A916U8G2_9SPHI|nr:sialate O-acetylesterase [Pedobacter quisquiliarum]GGC63321.1 9-O-acetylesterase [Pedobacter quisquiliarum]
MKSRSKTFLVALLAIFSFTELPAQVRLPQLVSDGMVLQRNAPLKIWGWAAPAEKISLTFNGKTYNTTASGEGKWHIMMKPLKAGGPYTMNIRASNSIQLKDILIGDVWFCSGQSNMALPMERVKEKFANEVATVNYPEIRNFFIPTIADVSKVREDLPPGKWTPAVPEHILSFGAVSYFFAKDIYNKYKVPIGIINSSVGGTPIQAWTSEEGLKQIPQYASRVEQLKDSLFVKNLVQQTAVKNKAVAAQFTPDDAGLKGAKTWYDPTYVPENWHAFWLPGYWEDQGIRGLKGVVWFRKEITLPESVNGKAGKLMFGAMVDADETYVNGKQVGNVTYKYPPRRYEIPAGLLKAGKNTIVIRLTNTTDKGGFVPDKSYNLLVDGQTIDLRGDWQYKVGQVFTFSKDIPSTPNFSAQDEPTGLYKSMVAPVLPYAIKGVLWYQGETNSHKPEEYETLLKALIADWRSKWAQPNLPFIYAQLPNFMEVDYAPAESKWAVLREGQRRTLAVPNTGMAVGIDAGEWNDIHPLDKQTIGKRMALAAQKVAYGDAKVVAYGPMFESAIVEGDQIRIRFSTTGSGLVAKGDKTLKHFAIAGADKKFVWGTAAIEGNEVVVSSKQIQQPRYVRYAWADNPDFANLYNQEGLPASPFKTDE